MTTLIISDLHLHSKQPALTSLFVDFLSSQVAQARDLYILGDLFEAWLGDDAIDEDQARVIAALKSISDTGVNIAVMHGNRDFLLGSQFAKSSGARIIDDPFIVDLAGHRTLLMHGDTLCTDDTAYQAFRGQVRNPEFIRTFLSLPVAERIRQAEEYRKMSQTEVQSKPEEIMDVNEQAVLETMTHYRVNRLVHGHTHRPAIHNLFIDNKPAQRYVLGDWSANLGNVLVCDSNQCRYVTFSREDLKRKLF